MRSTVLFDITKTAYDVTLFFNAGFVLIVIACLMLFVDAWRKRRGYPCMNWRRRGAESGPAFPFKVMGAGALLSVLIIAKTYYDYASLRSAYESRSCELIDGTIKNFHPGLHAKGKGNESFDVGNAHLAYSAFDSSPGFHQAAGNGGILRDGLHVRMQRCGADIAWLETIENP
ncbi:hypothetical protein [Undibacterium sp. TC9W]|uniref:hypothetical protein n=1 Tax=Undibacterium sp. TC9W TaxID=3413053 RepID=UPI003BF25CB7